MSSGLYVALSGQVALERRLAAIANNVANVNTAGFRAEEVKFDSVLAAAGSNGSVAFASPGDSFISRKTGPVSRTGNPLDVAVQGDAWLAISTPDGTAYTRDGRLHMSAAGDLQSVEGYSVLDPGGSPLLIDPTAGDVRIGDDGTITRTASRSARSVSSRSPPAASSSAPPMPASSRACPRNRSKTSPTTASARAISRAPTSIRSSK